MGGNTGQADERPIHRVWLEEFEIGIYPVKRKEYEEFLNDTGRTTPREWENPAFSNPFQPVVGVSWNDAVVYCIWQTTQGQICRLPTEAEWERAVRGNQQSHEYAWGNKIPEWIPNKGKGPLAGPWNVDLGQPSDFGLLGIGANIHEWCSDWHSKTYYEQSPTHNPTGPPSGFRRVSRGGSWRHAVTLSRNSARSKLDPTYRYTDYGFRLAR